MPTQSPSVYKHCFTAIEEAATTEPLTPIEAYEMYDKYLVSHDLDPTIYTSMAITSGGYKRDPELDFGEVIARNSEYGVLAADALIDQFPMLDRADIIIPSELGKVKGWSQSDFLLFWGHVIVGPTVEVAEVIEDNVRQSGTLELEGFANAALPVQNRRWDYHQFAATYANALKEVATDRRIAGKRLEPNNVQAAVFILDQSESLGAYAEEVLCRRVGIPPQFQLLDASVLEGAGASFRQQVGELKILGATALGTHLNRAAEISFAGISAGRFETTDIANTAGFRKTGLINAIMSKNYYTVYSEQKPPRHQGNKPILVREQL